MVKLTRLKFETSAQLKTLLADYFENWKKRHGGDFLELADKCGVTPAYLSHVRRYGRIPSRPVLILLALNFKIDGQKLFEAAGIKDPYPYDAALRIGKAEDSNQGMFSVQFNMDAFVESIRGIVRSEVRHRSVRDLLGSRPLKIGMNYHEYWLFDSRHPPLNQKHTGLFPELCEMLGLALQKEVQLVHVPFADYISMLSNGQLDLFGPTMIVPNLPSQIPFTSPIFRLGVSALFRQRPTAGLEELPIPHRVEDLRDERYKIAVPKNSLHHLIANTRLNRSDASLILCASDEEGLERVLMKGISRPAHVFISNSVTCLLSAKDNPKSLEVLFSKRNSLIDLAENAIAVRPDWPEVIPVINDAIRFMQNRGGFIERLEKVHQGDLAQVVEV